MYVYIDLYAYILVCVYMCVCVCIHTHGQAPLSMGFSKQEYWSGEPFCSLGVLPLPEIEPGSLLLQQILYCVTHWVSRGRCNEIN